MDLAETRNFYHERLGLEIVNENEAAIVFRCENTQLTVTKSTTGTADAQTQATWFVDDVRAEVAELRSRGVSVEEYDMPGLKVAELRSRGVSVDEYDMPGLKTENGIADIGFAWAAWILDPGKNALGILQVKGRGAASTPSEIEVMKTTWPSRTRK